MAIPRIAVALAATLVLGGCASMRDDNTTTYVVPPASSQATVQDDTAYMQKVEQQARMRGIDVRWINPPTKRIKTVATR